MTPTRAALHPFRPVAFLVMVVAFAVSAIALAQPADPAIDWDFTQWFVDRAGLVGAIIALTYQFRKRLKPKWMNGLGVVVFAIALGGALGVLGHFAGLLDEGFVGSLLFGLGAGVASVLSVDAARVIFGNGTKTPPGTGTLPGA